MSRGFMVIKKPRPLFKQEPGRITIGDVVIIALVALGLSFCIVSRCSSSEQSVHSSGQGNDN